MPTGSRSSSRPPATARSATTAAASRSTRTPGSRTSRRSRSSSRCCTRAASSRTRLTTPPAACTASASRSSMRCPTSCSSRSRATRSCGRRPIARGKPKTKLQSHGAVNNRRGTTVRFHPDPEIFGKSLQFRPATVFKMIRAKAFLFKGVEIRWKCDKALLKDQRRDARRGDLAFRGRPQGRAAGDPRQAAGPHGPALLRRGEAQRRRRPHRMGGGLAWRRGRRGPFLCEHGADAAGRQPRDRPAHGDVPQLARIRRPHRQSPRRADDRRGRDGRRRRPAVAVHQGAAVPGPDQGPARHARGAEAWSRRS